MSVIEKIERVWGKLRFTDFSRISNLNKMSGKSRLDPQGTKAVGGNAAIDGESGMNEVKGKDYGIVVFDLTT